MRSYLIRRGITWLAWRFLRGLDVAVAPGLLSRKLPGIDPCDIRRIMRGAALYMRLRHRRVI